MPPISSRIKQRSNFLIEPATKNGLLETIFFQLTRSIFIRLSIVDNGPSNLLLTQKPNTEVYQRLGDLPPRIGGKLLKGFFFLFFSFDALIENSSSPL